MSTDHPKPTSLLGSRGWQDLAAGWGRRGRSRDRRHTDPAARPAAPRATPQPACIWSPRNGDAQFTGQPGQDLLMLRDVTLTQFIIAMNLREPGLSLHLDADGGIGFIDRAGEPCVFSGDLTLNGATLRWDGVLRIVLA
ncbi:hypothetical protein [Falsiroseomonas tokyonensis]|uniref:Uncharacterized protein n=1 Tax=Falsiroseomonas tokyonensis TaxID=430521 RepID=A0ABV7BMQ3_9PROT|nr:hypothetical protein [Falsiroseomonas tokyonensis]MBU8536875.1 hypothetical protein [Falsiroseomonas tokyonensis]